MRASGESHRDEFPRVTWEEVRDHLVQRLIMDAEWIVEQADHLVWWPTPLPMSIRVIDSGEFPDSPDNWLRVSGTTRIAVVEEGLGRELMGEYNADYPVGSFVYVDGAIYLTTIYAINPRNRSLLCWFHQALLIQAASALGLAAEWAEFDGVEIPRLPHPISGERDDVDELVRIYGRDELNYSVDLGLPVQVLG